MRRVPIGPCTLCRRYLGFRGFGSSRTAAMSKDLIQLVYEVVGCVAAVSILWAVAVLVVRLFRR